MFAESIFLYMGQETLTPKPDVALFVAASGLLSTMANYYTYFVISFTKASAKRSRLFTIHCSTNVEHC